MYDKRTVQYRRVGVLEYYGTSIGSSQGGQKISPDWLTRPPAGLAPFDPCLAPFDPCVAPCLARDPARGRACNRKKSFAELGSSENSCTDRRSSVQIDSISAGANGVFDAPW